MDVLLRFRGDSSGAVRASAQTSAALGGVGKTGANTGAILKKAFVITGAAVAVGLGFAAKKAMDFEAILSEVEAKSGATADEMERLKQVALDLGASTKFSATEVAAAQVELVKAGVTVSEVLGGALKGSLSLAAAGNLELADAASFAANAMNLFGLRGKQVARIADAFATAANSTTADVADFGMALTQGGAAAKAAGLTFQETMVILEALAAAGVKNSDAGTSMKTALIQLLNPTKKQAAAARELNLEFVGQNGKMKDAAQISGMLRKATDDMTKAERLKLFATIAGTDGVRTLLALYDAGPKKLEGYKRSLGEVGTAERTAAKLQDNLRGKWEELSGAIETLAIQIGDRLIPALSDGAQRATQILNDWGDEIGQVADVLGSEMGVAITGSIAALALFAFAADKAIKAAKALRVALLTINPVVAAVSLAVGLLTFAFIRSTQETDKYADALDKAKGKLDALANSADEARRADVELATARTSLKAANMSVGDAERALKQAREEGRPREIARAELALEQARNGARQATINLTDAERANAEAVATLAKDHAKAKKLVADFGQELRDARGRVVNMALAGDQAKETIQGLGLQADFARKAARRQADAMGAVAQKGFAIAKQLAATNPKLAETAREGAEAASAMAGLARAWGRVISLPEAKAFVARFKVITTIEENRAQVGRPKALGGAFRAGSVFRVNERGDELGVFSLAGRVLSHSDSMRAASRAFGGGRGGGGVTVYAPIVGATFLTGDKRAADQLTTMVVKGVQGRLSSQPNLLSAPRPA